MQQMAELINPKKLLNVDNPHASDFHVMPQKLRAGADYDPGANPGGFDNIISNKSVAPFY